jgi:hypothetical protein
MTTTNKLTQISMAAIAATLGLFWSGDISTVRRSALVSSAEARIGRPLTPLSYAGVARRTTRRAVAVGAAAVVVAPVVVVPRAVVVTPVCGQVVNSYGQIVTVCR